MFAASNRQAGAAFGAARTDDCAAGRRAHTGTKTMGPFAF